MREKTVENYLRQKIEKNGGICLKFVCPGSRGVPDRICLFPNGVVAFVEVKAPGKEVKKGGMQEFWQKRFQEFGFKAVVVNDKKEADFLAHQLASKSKTYGRMAENLRKKIRGEEIPKKATAEEVQRDG